MGDTKHRGVVYGFLTTGTERMWRYDASDGSFLVSNRIEAVDCVYCALSDEGIVRKEKELEPVMV